MGELERDRTLEKVLFRDPRGVGLEARRGRLVVDAVGDSSLGAALVFWTPRIGKEGGGSGD